MIVRTALSLCLVLVAGLLISASLGDAGTKTEKCEPEIKNVVRFVPVPVHIKVKEEVIVEYEQDEVMQVFMGMHGLASTEWPYNLRRLMRYWKRDEAYAWKIATWIVEFSDKYSVDPFDLLAMAWHESRFNPYAKGDCKDGKCISCGIIQINTRYKRRRPTCSEAMSPFTALNWAARELASLRDPETGLLVLYRYNGGSKYEVKVRRTAELARWHSKARLEVRNWVPTVEWRDTLPWEMLASVIPDKRKRTYRPRML